jgi:hypothetical protein
MWKIIRPILVRINGGDWNTSEFQDDTSNLDHLDGKH